MGWIRLRLSDEVERKNELYQYNELYQKMEGYYEDFQ